MIDLPLSLAACHMLGDFVFQTDWMAARKLTNWKVRAIHVLVYSATFLPVLLFYYNAWAALLFFLALILTHFVLDSRRWVSGEKWPPKPIIVDQTLHLVVLAILSSAFGSWK